MGLRNKTGKDITFLVAFVLSIIGFVCLAVAFVTPYWIVSWPRVFSQFKRLGLWEACFAGLVIEMDPRQKAYHGCWWILAKEFYDIRDYVMPPWFVTIQVLVTVDILCEFSALVIQGMVFVKSQVSDATGYSKRLPPFNLVQAVTYITLIMTFVKLFVTVLFFGFFFTEKNWMPRPDLNYPSWSFGLFILSGFFSLFASIGHVTYNRIIRSEYREAPRIPLNPTSGQAPTSSMSLSLSRSRDY